MIKSMTGFGRCELTEDNITVSVELKSVNHKYLDQSIRLPRKLSAFEGDIRSRIKERVIRGKLEGFVSIDITGGSAVTVSYNEDIAAAYVEGFQQMADRFGMENNITTSTLAMLPDVFEHKDSEIDEEKLKSLLLRTLDGAIDMFVASREREGESLKADLLNKLYEMEKIVAFIEERAPEIIVEYRQNLRKKVDELLEDNTIDESRLAAEVVLYADKICVDEETVRLKSHINEAKRLLSGDSEVGRKLDFIAQEMNRESNTILSKSTDVAIADCGIELKTLIEKIREQIQNLE